MKTFHRVCIEDYMVVAKNGDRFELKRGKEYLTSEEENGLVVVFSAYWVRLPVTLFAGERIFTKE